MACTCTTMIDPAVTPDAPLEAQPTLGLIGMGAMGTMYAKAFAAEGWKKWVYRMSSLDHSSLRSS